MEILLVEDDKSLSEGIALVFQGQEYHFVQAFNCKEARRAVKEQPFDLILMDIGLPDGNGIALCREFRERMDVPILFLTANDTEFDEVAGLEAGANDYITKPFSLAVLRARVAAALRAGQSKAGQSKGCIVIDDFKFDFDNLAFYKGGQELFLSRTEQRLLRILTEHPGRRWERESLLSRLWGNDGEFVDENALSVTVKRLRDKLEEDSAHPKYIKTVYGVGYMWYNEE